MLTEETIKINLLKIPIAEYNQYADDVCKVLRIQFPNDKFNFRTCIFCGRKYYPECICEDAQEIRSGFHVH